MAVQHYAKNGLNFRDLISIYGLDNLQALEKKLSYFSEKTQEIQQQSAQALESQRGEIQENLLRLKAELDQQVMSEANRIKLLDIDVRRRENEMNSFIQEQTLALQKRKLDQDAVLGEMELLSENQVENAYLAEQGRSARVTERLNALALQLQAIKDSADMNLKDVMSRRDAAVKKVAKEHISDR